MADRVEPWHAASIASSSSLFSFGRHPPRMPNQAARDRQIWRGRSGSLNALRGQQVERRLGCPSTEEFRQIVVGAGAIATLLGAAGALVDQDELAALVEKAYRLHERATRGCPVAGVHVDVHGPEAVGAVVRVAVACNPAVAVRATEVLASAREPPRQRAPRFVEPNGARRRDPSAGSPSRARASGRRSWYLLLTR